MTPLYLIIGGALGTLARYYVADRVGQWTDSGAAGIFAVNIAGSFAIGLFLGLGEERFDWPFEARLLVATGFLGGFTTFSTLTWQTLQLFEVRDAPYALLNLLAASSPGWRPSTRGGGSRASGPDALATLAARTHAAYDRLDRRQDMAADPKQTVLDFCEAWASLDKQRILDAFTDDAVYHNMPMAPATGKAAIEQLLAFILPQGKDGIRFEVTNVAADGNVVLTERRDFFHVGDKVVELPVMGAFEVRDGKIAAWRDYFDMATWTKQSGGG